MKTLIIFLMLLIAVPAMGQQKAETTIKKELRKELGYLISIKQGLNMLTIIKTTDLKEVERLFFQATGLEISVKTALADGYYFDFNNPKGSFYCQFGNLIYKANGKINFRQLSRKQRKEII